MVKIESLTNEQLEKKGVFNWPIWEKEVSEFDWYYDTVEQCYFLDGEVEVTTKTGEKFHIKKGDFVTFNKGLACTWKVIKPVRKHYNFD
ncbi:MAG: cupin domain-containing protein [Bacteroidales bacterium]|nr:cupin domain-containing protein [Bacteroidales bacterium]